MFWWTLALKTESITLTIWISQNKEILKKYQILYLHIVSIVDEKIHYEQRYIKYHKSMQMKVKMWGDTKRHQIWGVCGEQKIKQMASL